MAAMKLLLLAAALCLSQPSSLADLLAQARQAQSQGQAQRALRLLDQAVAAEPRNLEARMLRGLVHDSLREYKSALTDFDAAVQTHPDYAEAYDQRGSTHFKMGHIQESIDDFGRFLKLRPKERAGHWRRGIALYYAGRFQEGKKQFEAYEQVDRNDVENAVWRYLCMARVDGVAKARASMLKIGHDRRVPMTEIYALFSGQAGPKDVLAAAESGKLPPEEQNQCLFYAHLYLGLYYESLDDQRQTAEHIRLAAEKHSVRGYMGDVARLHWDLLRKKRAP